MFTEENRKYFYLIGAYRSSSLLSGLSSLVRVRVIKLILEKVFFKQSQLTKGSSNFVLAVDFYRVKKKKKNFDAVLRE